MSSGTVTSFRVGNATVFDCLLQLQMMPAFENTNVVNHVVNLMNFRSVGEARSTPFSSGLTKA